MQARKRLFFVRRGKASIKEKKRGNKFHFFRNPLFKRNIVPLKGRKALMDFLREQLKDPSFLKSLTQVTATRGIFALEFEHNGKKYPVIVKDTSAVFEKGSGGIEVHGRYYKKFRQIIEAHQREAKAGRIDTHDYILRTPKAYGLIGNRFLIMEGIEEGINEGSFSGLLGVKERISNNFELLREKGLIEEAPQVSDFIEVGQEKGRVVLYSVYDFG
jgi:hypothetical protein